MLQHNTNPKDIGNSILPAEAVISVLNSMDKMAEYNHHVGHGETTYIILGFDIQQDPYDATSRYSTFIGKLNRDARTFYQLQLNEIRRLRAYYRTWIALLIHNGPC